MMPNVKGDRATRRQIFAYSILVAASTVLPIALGIGGLAYAAVAAIGGGAFVAFAWRLLKASADELGGRAMRLFTVSIFYLFALFAALLAERLIGLAPLV
jgi:protoheme IX farnesyltransferase